ncbi:unnamed protein product [Onchocerca flexuosa]|uniref:PhoLip_ATPase_C domain-containing protein n=1 Tax=Onchocerca flexuosa TaxID=387005 RepID=A0A183H2B0_9BILA|nr:unnamed protein product [Onchocerca flexuosa]
MEAEGWESNFPIAIGGSLSWMELSVIEYETVSLILSPVLAILQEEMIDFDRFQIIQLKFVLFPQNLHLIWQKKLALGFDTVEFDLFQYQYIANFFSWLTMIGLSVPAFYSWMNSAISADASWESIDYLLIGMSIMFMPNYKYSEMWLQLSLTAYDFMVLEQAKFWAASIGQWFVQNMAHATIFALIGKIVMFGALVRYFIEIKQRRKSDYSDLSLTLVN